MFHGVSTDYQSDYLLVVYIRLLEKHFRLWGGKGVAVGEISIHVDTDLE